MILIFEITAIITAIRLFWLLLKIDHTAVFCLLSQKYYNMAVIHYGKP